MTLLRKRSQPGVATTGQAHPPPTGTWTIDPTDSSVWFARRTLQLGTITGRLHSVGVIHLDELPPVGAIRFQQPSGLPLLIIALDPASIQTHSAVLAGSDVGAVSRQRWWTLRSESLEILPSGTWRVMATLTADGTPGLVELHLEIEPAPSDPDWLVLRGGGVLDRAAFGGKRASILGPQVRLELVVRARKLSRSPRRLTPQPQASRHHAGARMDIRPRRRRWPVWAVSAASQLEGRTVSASRRILPAASTGGRRAAGSPGRPAGSDIWPRPFGRPRTERTRPPASALGASYSAGSIPARAHASGGAARDPRRGRRHQAHPRALPAVTEGSAPNTSRKETA
jgi:polyisoprenoid-binding protein YceI